jgi:hypothetical protein
MIGRIASLRKLGGVFEARRASKGSRYGTPALACASGFDQASGFNLEEFSDAR